MTTRGRGQASARWAAGLVVLTFLALLGGMLRAPIVDLATKSFCAADMSQEYALTSLGEGRRPSNAILADTTVQMQPWLDFARERLRAGELPLWNPYNATGVPLLANYQSAVLSPFSLPYWLLEAKHALIVAAFLKLAAAGLGFALFLRTLGLGLLPALLGATSLAFAGQFVLLLGYPHSGVNATVGFALLAAESALRAHERGLGARALALRLGGLALALAAGQLAGHPEAFAFVLALVAGWILLRLLELARGACGPDGAARLGAGFVLAGLLAAALGAPQTLPFLEYLGQSPVALVRQELAAPSLVSHWPLAFFPNALGSPLPESQISLGLPEPNYPQVNSHYVGASVMLAALLGLGLAWRDRRARYFALAALAWIVLTCDLFGLGALWTQSTPLGHFAPLFRAQLVWIVGTSGLVALAAEHLLRLERPRPGAACALAALAAVSWWPTRAAADALREAHLAGLPAERIGPLVEAIQWSANLLSVAFACGAAALAAALVLPRRSARACALVVLLGAIYASTGWTLRDYNPTIPDRMVYPRTEAVRVLQREVGDGRLVILGENGLPPNTNLAYRLATLQGYDALGVRRFDDLALTMLGMRGNWRDVRVLGAEALRLCGVDHVLTSGDWLPVGTALAERNLQPGTSYRPIELQPGRALEQWFLCDRANLSEVAALVSVVDGTQPRESGLRMRLYDNESGERLAERVLDSAEVRTGNFYMADFALTWHPFPLSPGPAFRWATLSFPPRADSRGRWFRVALEATAEAQIDAISAWVSEASFRPDTALAVADEAVVAASIFDYATPRAFERVGRIARFTLWRASESLGAFFSVGRAFETSSRQQTLLTLTSGRFDPYRAVLIERDPAAAGDPDALALEPDLAPAALPPASAVEVLSRESERVRLRALRTEPGWLVACQSFYPGWRALVNGVERPVRCANYAFQAVELDAGTSEIELFFDPPSLRLGLWLALGGLLTGLVALARLSRASARR